MKITFKKDEKQLELFKAIASKNRETSENARIALAALLAPVAATVLDQAATSRAIYTDVSYNMGEVPSIPLDLYFDNTEGLFTIWSQSIAGGLATNEVWGMDEYRFKTYKLDSAVSLLKSYIQNARLDVVSKALQRLVQEVLVKTEYQAYSTLLTALAGASTGGAGHLLNSTANVNSLSRNLSLDDINRLWTKVRRLRTSWLGGTPTATPGKGLTDLFMSPEMVEKIRAMAYNPVNVTATPNTDESTALGLPDGMREEIFANGGLMTLFGVKINELLEFGIGGMYNSLFDDVYSGGASGTSPTSPTFSASTQELVLGADLSVTSAIRVIASDSDTGSTFTLEDDDQFVKRTGKIGWYGSIEEGRMVADTKAFVGLVV